MGIPKQLYSDQEGSFNNVEFIKLLNQHKIKHITTIAGAHTVERFNRTLKEKIQTRLDAMGLPRNEWLAQLHPILNKYNNTVHSTTKISPNGAKKGGNKLLVSFNILNKAKRNRDYEEIKFGDDVRIRIKKESGITKGYMPKWSRDIYQVTFIKNNDYLVNDGKRKVHIRAELIKV